MTDRTKRLRDEIIDTVPQICPERARYFTESMKKTQGLPIAIRRSMAFENIMDNMSLYVRDGQLLAGNTVRTPRAAGVYPEYSVEWIYEELEGNPYYLNERPNDIYEIDEVTQKEIVGIMDFWRDKTLHASLRQILPGDAKTAWDIVAIDDDWVSANGLGNLMPNYETLMETGIRGQIDRTKAEIAKLDLREPGAAKKKFFLDSVVRSNEAVIRFAHRYADFLESLAKKEENPDRKKELKIMAENCKWVPENKPRTFWEALQFVFFIHAAIQVETNGLAVSFGRFDQFLYPYYTDDIKKGKLTRAFALELVENFLIKVNEINILRSWYGAKIFPGYHMAINLCIGGQTRDGKDAVNDLSYIVLDATANMKLPKPSVSAKWFPGTSDKFLDRCLQVIQEHKGGQPALYNDLCVMRILKNMGVSDDDAWNWAPVGCIEASIPGKWDFACKGPRLNIAKIFEFALHNGRDPKTGVQLLPGKGDMTVFNSTEEVLAEFKRQLHYYMDLQVITEHMNDEMHIQHDICPFHSSLIEDCIGRGKDLIEGGSIYSADGGPTVGAISASDALSAIDYAVFREEWITMDQLYHALLTNYEDNTTQPTGEEIYQYLNNKAPKFGNDDDRADKWAVAVTDYIGSTYMKDFKNSRYGKGPIPACYTFSQSSVTACIAFGQLISALPDGRKAGTPVNNGVSPATGAEKNGLTANINSGCKLPSIWFQKGAIFNVRLMPDQLTSQKGRDLIAAAVKTYFEHYQYHIQFNVHSNETLLDAQVHPEKYKDLIVRIAGYSAFFTPLNESLQEDIIKRAELQ
jgi:formate C-acetyltransferase